LHAFLATLALLVLIPSEVLTFNIPKAIFVKDYELA